MFVSSMGQANFELKTHAMSHRSQKGYKIKLVKLQNFLNDVVIDSPHLGGMKSRAEPSTAPGGGQPSRKRNPEDPLVGASKIWKVNGANRGRVRGGGHGGRGQSSQNTGRIDFSAIANASTSEERKRHIEEELCFTCHKKGHRLFSVAWPEAQSCYGSTNLKAMMVARLLY
jgi:hypothetical protein